MSLVKKNKVEFIRGRGTLQGGKKVVVAKTLDADGKPDGEIGRSRARTSSSPRASASRACPA